MPREAVRAGNETCLEDVNLRPRIYEVYDHTGSVVEDAQGVIAELERWRRETQQAVLDAFPERPVSSRIDPFEQRKHFADLGFETSPVAVIPDDPESLDLLISILKQGGVLTGGVFEGIENKRDHYSSLTSHNSDLGLVLFVDPSMRIGSHDDVEVAALDEEFSRIILGHELGHSLVRSVERVRVDLDEFGVISRVIPLESDFGTTENPFTTISSDNDFVGSVWGEGFATLMASSLYHPVADSEIWLIGADNDIGLVLPGHLLSRPEGYVDAFTADNHCLAALILETYDQKYPGVIADIKRYARCEIDLDTFGLILK